MLEEGYMLVIQTILIVLGIFLLLGGVLVLLSKLEDYSSF